MIRILGKGKEGGKIFGCRSVRGSVVIVVIFLIKILSLGV